MLKLKNVSVAQIIALFFGVLLFTSVQFSAFAVPSGTIGLSPQCDIRIAKAVEAAAGSETEAYGGVENVVRLADDFYVIDYMVAETIAAKVTIQKMASGCLIHQIEMFYR